MRHIIETSPNEKEIKWSLTLSQCGNLCLKGNGDTVIVIDTKGDVTLFGLRYDLKWKEKNTFQGKL